MSYRPSAHRRSVPAFEPMEPRLLLDSTPLITEFLADNSVPWYPADPTSDWDWIEIHNPTTEGFNLIGWHLTDDPDDLTRWTFPDNTVLRPGKYLIVFASGLTGDPDHPGDLHTNFRLSRDGEYLALVAPGGQQEDIVSEYDFPAQQEDISYGLYEDVLHYFATPSPGLPNLDAFVAFVGDTKFDHDRGFYDAPFDVTITTGTPDATIYYTTDGSEPSESNGWLFNPASPIPITTTTTLRAVAVKTDWEPSNVDTQTYVFLQDIINQPSNPAGFPASWGGEPADYQMDPDIVNNPLYSDTLIDDLLSIPTMSLVMDMDDLFNASQGIYANPNGQGVAWERPGSIELFYPEGYDAPDDGFQVNCGVRIYGGVGRQPQYKKHSFRLLFKADYGPTKLNYPLFGEEAADLFDTVILRSNFNDAYVWHPNDSQYIRDEYARQLHLALGDPSPTGNFVHLYVNGLYWGLYNPCERPDQSFGATYFGGDKDDWDALNSGQATGESDLTEWSAMLNLVRQGMTTNAQYQRLQGNNPDGTNNPAYPCYLDVENYINFMLTNFFVGNTDWPGHNWYAARAEDPGSTGFKSFLWDAEWVVGLNSNVNTNVTNRTNAGTIAEPYGYLRQNAEFQVLFGDLVHKAFFNGGPFYVDPDHPQWDPDHPDRNQPAALYAELADQIERAMVGESARWGDVASGTPKTLANWQSERDGILNTYMSQRSAVVLQQLRNLGLYPPDDIGAPVFYIDGFYQHGGTVSEGNLLVISAPSGILYYTLDGSDPRLPGGDVLTGALIFDPQSPVALDASVHVKARAYSGGAWSALAEAMFMQEFAPPLRVTEIMYNPPAPTQDEIDAFPEELQEHVDNDWFEYVELQNVGDKPLDLEGMRFSDGIDFTFPARTLGAGEYVLVVRDQFAFEVRYGTALTIAGEFEGALDNAGENIFVECAVGGGIHDFDYKNGWFDHTDGGGFSLVVRDPLQDAALWGAKDGWRASWQEGGNPGAADPSPVDPGDMVINEILTHSDGGVEDWIELYNTTTDQTIDITGWFLSDDPTNLDKYEIPAGTILGPGEYVVFNQVDHFDGAFALSELGDDLYLTSQAPDGTPGGYREDEFFGASENGVTFGRYIKPSGGKDFVPMVSRTMGETNSAPVIPDVVINEIMYNPEHLGAPEWIELYNRTDADVGLYDGDHPENTWKFTDGVSYTFPTNAYVPAGGYALVIGVDRPTFESVYGPVPGGVNVYGLWDGALANDGERIELSRPGDPEWDDPPAGEPVPYIPYIQVEKIRYDDGDPWPNRPDGGGTALSRISPDDYGNDPANWVSSTVGGTPGALNQGFDDTPPTQPTDLAAIVISDTGLRLTWTAATDPQSGVAYYRVYRDNLVIDEPVTTSFNDTQVDPARTYSYKVSAVNLDDIEGARSEPPLTISILSIDAVATTNATTVSIAFTETVTQAAAEDLANYGVTYDGGAQEIDVIGAVLQAEDRTVLLTLDQDLAYDVTYTLAVTGIVAESGIEIMPNSQIEFIYYAAGSGTILREYWLDISGTRVLNLTSDDNYPYNPSGAGELSSFEAPTNFADNYGTRMRGYLHPPATGYYTFYIASDNASELRLSTDEDPANAVHICRVAGWVESRDWFNLDQTKQQSAPIHLEVSQRYYVEALHKEVIDNDNLSVAWQLPDGTLEGPIPSERLSPFVVEPPDVTVSIAATDEFAAEEGQDPGAFAISRVGNITESLMVYYLVSGTASSADYTAALWGHVDIPAGQASATIVITPNDDEEKETDETVILTLTANPNYLLDTTQAAVTIADNDDLPPVVTGVVLNPHDNRTVRGVSKIEPSGIGVRTVLVTFSKDVTFLPGDVTAEKVTFDDEGNQTAAVTILPENITVSGTGTSEMTITFADSWEQMVDTWVRITLADAIADADSHALDGEPAAGGSGLGYIYDDALDLPSGDGAAGGDAVFYVGSLRGDYQDDSLTPGPPDGRISSSDVDGFASAYQSSNLDADFQDDALTPGPPDGEISSSDVDGFASAYQRGASLSDLPASEPPPMAMGGGMAVGALSPLPLAAAEPAALTDSPETALLAEAVETAEPQASSGNDVATSAPATGFFPSDGSSADDFDALLTVDVADLPPAFTAWSPPAAERTAPDSPLAPDGDVVDLLAVPALEVALVEA